MDKLRDIWSKYDEAFQFLETRKRRQVKQLVLLNNLQRGDENISSSLLLTNFNRMVSNLYDDKMQVKFVPGEQIDQRRIQTMNLLAQNDYREMEMDKIEYDWIWDTLFFGRGYVETLAFDKKRKLMKPKVINPLAFGYDPYVDDKDDWRYYWKWITKNKYQLQRLIQKGIITGIKDTDEIPSGIEPYLWDYKVQREEARKATPLSADPQFNDVFQILEFFGYDDDGDKCIYWVDKNFSKILMHEKLDLKDGEDGDSCWPIVIKEAFREPHSSVNFSVPDILDDKHRARSVLLNLAFIAAKDTANPLYVYDPDKVQDITQLFSRQINQHIPVSDTAGAIAPLNRQEPLPASLAAFMQVLNQEANDPIGTGMALTPGKKGKQSATESAIQQQLNDLAQSLQSKVLQFGEKEFWSDWYHRYKRFTKKGDIKVATITGVKGMDFLDIDLGDIHTKYPPGVLIYSAKEAEYKELVLRRDLMQMYPQFQQSLSPDGMRNFNKYVFLPKLISDPATIDVILPKTVDELKAEAENDQMDKGEMPMVAETDNHEQHIAIHQMAQKNWATWTHIAWHEELLSAQKQAQLQQQQQQQQQQGGEGDKPKVGKDEQNPQNAASPLKTEINPKDNQKKS